MMAIYHGLVAVPLLLSVVKGVAAAGMMSGGGGSSVMEGFLDGEWRMGLRPRQVDDSNNNLQPFGGSLGGFAAPAISNSGDAERPYEVDGDTFPDFPTAANRACDNQKNTCADASNSGQGAFEVSDCDAQREECMAAGQSATATSFQEAPAPAPALVSSDADFDYFCDV